MLKSPILKLVLVKIRPADPTPGHILIVKNEENNTKLNIHLGPANEVSPLAEQLSTGDNIFIKTFKIPNLQANDFIAKEITPGEMRYEFRDQNLRPFWAGTGNF